MLIKFYYSSLDIMITATDEMVITGAMVFNIGLGAILGIAIGVVVLILSLVVVITTVVVFHLRARG